MKYVPVSIFLAISIIIIFLLYVTNVIKTVPCQKGVLGSFYRNFVHVEFYHVFVNLYALYTISRVEREIGFKKFVGLIVYLLVLNTILEVSLHKINPNIKCSVGFSGVLMGIMVWELVCKRKLDLYLLSAIVIMVVFPSIKSKKVSLSGHLIGAFSGALAGLVCRAYQKN